MANKYLDFSGLQRFFDQLKNLFAPKDRGIEYIRGTWTAASGTWTGVSTDSELYDGKQIILFMPYAGSGNATLNLTLAGGSTTGAKNVYFESTTRFTTHKAANSQLHMIYHKAQKIGTETYEGWWYMANRDTNDYAAHIGFNYGLWKTKTALYRYQLLFTVDETTLVPANAVSNSTATTKVLTTESFDPNGQIYYYNSTTTVSANAAIGASLRTQHSVIDLRYAFNTAKTLTANKSVYLVCDPQTDGTVKLASTPISQDLPTTDDGKVYKLLGRAYDSYRIYLYQDKPVYWYKNGGVQLYTRDASTVNGHTVNADVPANAVFTDTTYDPATASTDGLMSSTDKQKLDALQPAGAIPSCDLDTLTETMVGQLITANTYTHAPTTAGTLEVVASGTDTGQCAQRLYNGSSMYYRYRSGSGFGDWYKVTATKV